MENKPEKKRSLKRVFSERDLYATPSMLVDCIIPYINKYNEGFQKLYRKDIVIWCPFDTAESNYVRLLEKAGYEVIHSHINEGKDFFKYEPDNYDIIVSNPPFSLKFDIFKKIIFGFDKPFVLLMNMMAINYQNISNLFQSVGKDIQFIIPDKKVSFDGHTSSFCSGYVCYRFIDRTEFIHLPHNNTGKNYSR